MPRKSFAIPIDWFVCPVTKEELIIREDGLYSSHGRFQKNDKYGFWNFMPKDLEDLKGPGWQIWRKLQSNGKIAYKFDPNHNLGVGLRKDFLQFAEFCNFIGDVLDIGVGPQKSPTHMECCSKQNVFFVGVDPLIGRQPRSFAFVQALGEYLPFRNQLFDQVLFVTSLDHFIDPRIPLGEAKRVLKDNGVICMFLGQKDKNSPPPDRSPKWYRKLRIPQGAVDPFHFWRFTSKEFEDYVTEVGLRTEEIAVHRVDDWRKNYFYRLTKYRIS